MDFSDLPQAAQDRIAAGEIEAELILDRSKIPAKVARIRARIPWAKPDAWPDGPIQEQKRFEQGLFESSARDSLHQGRIQAARHLLGTAAGEYIRDGNLDTKRFDATLAAIGDWVCKKFRVKRAWFDAEKQGWRVMALRQRAASVQPVTVNSGNPNDSVPQFPKRASWLKAKLAEREWSKHDLQGHSGPEHRTTKKILDGCDVQEGVLRRVIGGLSSKPTHKGRTLPQVEYSEIPNN